MNSSETILEKRSSYETKSLISNIILQQGPQNERVIISDWNGNIHILRNIGGTRLQLLKEKKLFDSPILGMDEKRSKEGSSDELFVGSGDGQLKCYDAKNDKLIDFGQDPERRPIAKIISTDDRVFTFTWKRAMLYWEIKSKEYTFRHDLKENFIEAEYADPWILILLGNNTIAFINIETYRKGSTLKYKTIGYEEITKSISCYNKKINYLALGDTRGGIKILQKRENEGNYNLLSDKDQLTEDFSLLFVIKAHVMKIPPHIIDNPKPLNVEFPVNALEFKPNDKNILLSGGGDFSINIIDIEEEKGTKVKGYKFDDSKGKFTRPFTHLKFFSNGTSLITADINPDYYNIIENNKIENLSSTVCLFTLSENERSKAWNNRY